MKNVRKKKDDILLKWKNLTKRLFFRQTYKLLLDAPRRAKNNSTGTIRMTDEALSVLPPRILAYDLADSDHIW
jgi:hypothetical protein